MTLTWFVGGPWAGQCHDIPDGSWPWKVTTSGSWQSAYNCEKYQLAKWAATGEVIAITQDHFERASAAGGLDESLVREMALTRLYKAITDDHNDPTDESGDALTSALEFAESIIELGTRVRDMGWWVR